LSPGRLDGESVENLTGSCCDRLGFRIEFSPEVGEVGSYADNELKRRNENSRARESSRFSHLEAGAVL
jgi:hypothetical protein